MEDYRSAQEAGTAGNGQTDDSGALLKAIAAATAASGKDSVSGLHFPPGRYRIAADMVFPDALTLSFADKALLVPDAGVTVTIRSSIVAGMYPIFGGEGEIKGPLRVPEVFPQWFGGSGSAASVLGSIQKNDNTLTLQDPLDFCNGQYVAIPGARPCGAAAPGGLKGTVNGAAGQTSYSYTVVAIDDTGGMSTAATVTVQGGPAVISPELSISLQWEAAAGAAAYWIYGRTPGSVRRLAQVSETSWMDRGAAIRKNEPALPANLPAPGTLITRIADGGGSKRLILTDASAYRVQAFINHDDTFAIQRAFQSCGASGKMTLPSGTYRVTDTLVCQIPQLCGKGFAELQFSPLAPYDLKPCLDIVDTPSTLDHLQISGGSQAYMLDNPDWADPKLFGGQYYDALVHGSSGIRISGASRPLFREVSTRSNLKCGFVLDNRAGHISFYDCSIGGLAGVYCRMNTGDYFFEGCNITGTLCGVMFGVRSVSGHSGGLGAQFNRVHMGFAPYSFYQTIDDPELYRKVFNVEGMTCLLTTVQHEQIGEAAFKLLPKSVSRLMVVGGFGMSWSINSYSRPRTGWQFALPDELMPPEQRQQYAAWFGTLGFSDIPAGAVTGNLFMSSAPGAKGTARIEQLAQTSNLDGLSPANVDIIAKESAAQVTFSVNEIMTRRSYRSNNPVGRGNLLRHPENPSSYRVTGGSLTVAAADRSKLPAELLAQLGDEPVLLQFTPAKGAQVCNLQLDFAQRPYATLQLPLSMTLWIYTSSASGVNTRLQARTANGKLSDFYVQTLYPRGSWIRIAGEEGTPVAEPAAFEQMSINLPKDQPTLLCGIMVSEGPLSGYASEPHITADADVELTRPGDALILTSPKGIRFRITVDDQGKLTATRATE